MIITKQIAKQLRDVYFGGNWTGSNFKDNLEGVSWEMATTRVYSFNTIAILVFHTHYYISEVLKVFHGEPLLAKDEYSFNVFPVNSEEDWQKMLDKTWTEAETFAKLIEQFPEEKLWGDFTDKKYGSYFRNLEGIIEHLHYHLGQIVLIKKIIQSDQPMKH